MKTPSPAATEVGRPPIGCPCGMDIETLVDSVVGKTVSTTLLQLGIDTSQPLELQKDMQYLRGWRENAQAMRGKVATAVVSALVTASLTLGVLGFKSWMDASHRATAQTSVSYPSPAVPAGR
jgi:hypothetical protein